MKVKSSFKFLTLAMLLGCSSGQKQDTTFDFDKKLEKDLKEETSTKVVYRPRANFFLDKTEEYGLSNIKAYNINVVDFSGDNYSDLVILPSFYSAPIFLKFDIDKKKFVRVESPFDRNFKASFLLFYDLDNDLVLDAISGVLNQDSELTKQPLRIFYGKKLKSGTIKFIQKNRFKKATPVSSVGLIDYNLDGNLDLYVGNWFVKKNKIPFPGTDQLFEIRGKKIRDKTALLKGETKKNPRSPTHVNATPTYGVQICDMDQNGFPDIVTTSTNRYQNKLWMNKYKFREKFRHFEDYAAESGVASDPEGLINQQGGGRTFGLACNDYNNDGIIDLFLGELTHNYDGEDVDKSSLLTGRSLKFPPRFYRTEYFLDEFDPQWHQADRRAIWFDYNNDGLLDLLVDNSGYPPYTKLILFMQHPDHSFENKSQELGLDIVNPIATVIADFNRDGKMDILTSQSNIRDEKIQPRMYLYENNLDLKNKKSYRFFLRGERGNIHGLNATIILKVKTQKGFSYRRQIVSYSYGALPPQNEEGIHFGLDEDEELVNVSVIWPFSESLNQNRAGLQKTYYIHAKFENYMNVTLCESGDYLIGRRSCR